MISLSEKISSFSPAAYVYSYPPTRLYRSVADFSIERVRFTDDVNLYVHIPFCEQKCSFCGYLTAIDRSGDQQEVYVDAVIREITMYRDILKNKRVTSVNFGGGTPSLLSVTQFVRIMDALRETHPQLLTTAREISIEATPESIASGKIRALLAAGLTRVSVGIQSLADDEIVRARRHNFADASRRTIETLRDLDVPNICCDLMYGLDGQTSASFDRSVTGLLALRPDTIELYATVIIPGTPMARRESSAMSHEEKYHSYERARSTLLAAGYTQDCHLRFVLPGRGAYRQQEHVFAGQSLIGFGAGARTYGIDTHYRNVFAGGDGKRAVPAYIHAIQTGNLAVTDAVLLSPEEQMRRYVIYQLEHLDMADFHTRYASSFAETFPDQRQALADLGLAEEHGAHFHLTDRGLTFRDLIAQTFFSPHTASVESGYRQTVPLLRLRKNR